MKKFTIILENENHEFDVLKEYIYDKVELPKSTEFEFEILDIDNHIIVDYDEQDDSLIKIEILIHEGMSGYGKNQATEVLKALAEINQSFVDIFKNYLVLNSLHPSDMYQYRFIYHIKVKEFYEDPLWKSVKSIKKYNL